MTRTCAKLHCAIASAFIAAFLGLAVAAALAAPLIAFVFVELCCLATVAAILMLEVRPAVACLRGVEADRAHRLEIQKLRQHLDRLPETQHPLGM